MQVAPYKKNTVRQPPGGVTKGNGTIEVREVVDEQNPANSTTKALVLVLRARESVTNKECTIFKVVMIARMRTATLIHNLSRR